MTDIPQARVEKESRFSYVWLVPILCFVMVIGFAAHQLRTQGTEVVISFPDAEGVVPGKTILTHLGVEVGRVNDIEISSDTKAPGVLATARFTRSAGSIVREGTVFVAAKAEVSINGIQGLSSIFSGAKIHVRPGEGAVIEDDGHVFQGYPNQASLIRDQPGLLVRLTTPRSTGLEGGDAVFFRGLRVGSVLETELSSGSQNIILTAKIEERYAHIIRTNTVFWNASGVRAKVGLFGAKFNIDSMQSLMAGGISLATPDQPGARAQSNSLYELKSEIDPAWEKWSPRL